MAWLVPTEKALLFSKNDPEDPRLGDCVQLAPSFQSLAELSLPTTDFCIYGYPDDEGIAMNGGRPGAQNAPRSIRTSLYKMTPRLGLAKLPQLLDLGDGNSQIPLAERHERGRQLAAHLTKSKRRFIALGGGHDYGYADTCGFLDVHADNAVVINFDAHMDVRPTHQGFHSGTPFRRMLEEFSTRVSFFEFGLQEQCNSQKHFDWARSQGAQLFTMQDQQQGLLPLLQQKLKDLTHKKLFISLDMDVFSSTEAPGCSQSWVTGMKSADFFPALEWLIQNFDVAGLGMYEVSPPLDFDNQTSKLAALIAHRFIFSNLALTNGNSR